ncbi:PIN domain-containing protein [Ottowia sp. SB7-C50]|uniref:PIN domain-containing protein n=1 Tax=Ottowia sp. SB7-C50 TaxID=3081231 RepID=UPI00295497A9|nr:PIN domain-containing protein [Ottowia sp. SB7-C50]WOP16631.1 PIN domain-containing protein [Ottowia sp. SB7-C50]
MVFFDTNVLLYLLSADEAKADAAERALGQGGCISVQVLNELTNVCRRKLDMPWSRLHAWLAGVLALLEPVRGLDAQTHAIACAVAERHGIAFYDSLIVAAALQAGCDTLCSEDMHHGLLVRHGDAKVRIVNPFLAL